MQLGPSLARWGSGFEMGVVKRLVIECSRKKDAGCIELEAGKSVEWVRIMLLTAGLLVIARRALIA
jgi:prolipoprotein diacylglyceryltransferase